MGRIGLRAFVAAGLLGLYASACSREKLPAGAGGGPRPEAVYLDVRLTAGDAPASRAMTADAESAIDIGTLRVLVFDERDRLSDVAPCTIHNASFVTFRLRGSVNGEKYRVVMLVNAENAPSVAELRTKWIGRPYSELAEACFFFDVNGAWDTSLRTSIPMWAGFEPMVVEPDMPFPKNVRMIRAVARADVGVGVDENGMPDPAARIAEFRLDSVRLFGSKRRGWAMPRPDAFVADQDAALTEASAPSLWVPEYASNGLLPGGGYDAKGDVGGLLYAVPQLGGGSAALFRGIYLAESAEFPADSACLVLSGRYKSDPNASWNDVETTYYRVDFCRDVRDGGGLAPVLRNHRYLFSVKRVSGPGMPTVEEALKSASVNLEVDVESWNDFPETETADRIVPLHLELKGLDFAGDGSAAYAGDYESFRRQDGNGGESPYLDRPDAGGGYDRERLLHNVAVAAYRADDGTFDELLAFDRFDLTNGRNDLYIGISRRPYARRLVVLANFALGTAAGLEKALSVTTLSDFSSWSGFRQVCVPSGGQLLWNDLPFSGISRTIAPEELREGAVASVDVGLLAAVARLDVGINYADISVGKDGAGQPAGAPGVTYPFYLRGVYVVNYRSHFSLTPDFGAADELAAGTVKGPSPAGAPVEAAVPADMLRYPLAYPAASADAGLKHVLLRQIYLPETAAGSQTVLIVKGGPDASDDRNDTYYKVVLDKELLRNHRYVLNLNNITAPGAATPEAALNGSPAEAVFTLLTWENRVVDLPNVGQYVLSVREQYRNDVVHTCAAGDVIRVITTYPTWHLLDATDRVVSSGSRGTSYLTAPAKGSYRIKAGSLYWSLTVK